MGEDGRDRDAEREEFERAIADLDARSLYAGKFGATAPKASESTTTPDAQDADARERTRELREVRSMAQAFSDVTPIARDKYYRRPPGPFEERSTPPVVQAEELDPEIEPEPDPEPEPEPEPASAESAEPRVFHVINLRGISSRKVVTKLALAVDLAFKDRRAHVRILTGSVPGAAQLIREWLDGPGQQYVNEVTEQAVDSEKIFEIRMRS